MIATVADWVFDVDIDSTAKYCADVVEGPCECGYCRNFRLSVNNVYPELDIFLKQMGSTVAAPEELMPYEPTVFEGSYCISGTVVRRGSSPFSCGKCTISVLSTEETDYDTQCPKPYFVLRTNPLELPWVLEEDMDEVVSPANEPEYLQRMWDRLLQNAPESSLN